MSTLEIVFLVLAVVSVMLASVAIWQSHSASIQAKSSAKDVLAFQSRADANFALLLDATSIDAESPGATPAADPATLRAAMLAAVDRPTAVRSILRSGSLPGPAVQRFPALKDLIDEGLVCHEGLLRIDTLVRRCDESDASKIR